MENAFFSSRSRKAVSPFTLLEELYFRQSVYIYNKEGKILNLIVTLMALKAKETNPVDSTKISRCVSLHDFTLGFRCMPQALESGPLGFQSQLLHSPAVQS